MVCILISHMSLKIDQKGTEQEKRRLADQQIHRVTRTVNDLVAGLTL